MLNIAELWGSPWETLCLHYSELLHNIMLSICVFRISKSYERPCALTIVCRTRDEPRRRVDMIVFYICLLVVVVFNCESSAKCAPKRGPKRGPKVWTKNVDQKPGTERWTQSVPHMGLKWD